MHDGILELRGRKSQNHFERGLCVKMVFQHISRCGVAKIIID